MRTTVDGAAGVVELATDKVYPGRCSFLILLTKDSSSSDSMDYDKQPILWKRSIECANV